MVINNSELMIKNVENTGILELLTCVEPLGYFHWFNIIMKNYNAPIKSIYTMKLLELDSVL